MLEDILRLHYRLIEDFGGSHGVRDESRLKSVIAAPRQEVFGQAQYESLFDKAAVYIRNIIGDHPFVDGNKRTGITAGGVFLSMNDKQLNATPKELESFTLEVATKKLRVSEIADWLSRHSG